MESFHCNNKYKYRMLFLQFNCLKNNPSIVLNSNQIATTFYKKTGRNVGDIATTWLLFKIIVLGGNYVDRCFYLKFGVDYNLCFFIYTRE